MTREERFKAAQEARAKAAREAGGFEGAEIPDITYLPLTQNKCHVFRMVGESLEMREKPTDPFMIERSMVKDDDGKWFTMIWDKDSDWPMRRLMRVLAKYKWDKELNSGKGGRVYTNEGCELLKRFNTNNEDDKKVVSGMEPKKFILANVIDRMDDWCKENNHTKMIAWDMKEQDGKVYYTPGMSAGLYKTIFDVKCAEIGHHFEDVDFVIRRYSEKTRPNESTNYVLYWQEEKTAIGQLSKKDDVDYYSKIVEGDLTDEELSYVRYELENIPFISKPTPAGVILKKLGKFIKAVDAKYDLDVYTQLVELKEKEMEDWKNKKKEEEQKDFVKSSHGNEEESEYEDSEDELPNEVEEEVVAPPKNKVTKQVQKKVEITKDAIELWPGLERIKDMPNNLKLIKNIDVENQEITYVEGEIAECTQCSSDIHNDLTVCPCGAEFE